MSIIYQIITPEILRLTLFGHETRSGPFAYWYHRHRFEPTEHGTTMMTDEVEYELPLGWMGEMFGGGFTRAKLQKMFNYRHQVVLRNFANT